MVNKKNFENDSEFDAALDAEIYSESALVSAGRPYPAASKSVASSTAAEFDSEILSESASVALSVSLADSESSERSEIKVESGSTDLSSESESVALAAADSAFVELLTPEQRAMSEFARQILAGSFQSTPER